MSVPSAVRLHNGSFIPIIGLGTWQSTGDAVRVAIDAGYRHIDTAQMYQNEADVGEAIQDKISSSQVKREDLFVTTKLFMTSMAPENVHKETLVSLKKLRIDYIDLYLLHHPVALSDEGMNQDPPMLFPAYKNGALKTTFIDPLDTWKEMEKLVDEGLVKAIGLSNMNIEQLRRVYDNARIKPANLQVECHAWLPQYDLVQFCEERGISFTSYGPLGSPGRPATWSPTAIPLLEEPVLQTMAAKHGKTVAQVLLRNLMQRGIIVIPKSSNPDRIRSNIQVTDFELSSEDMDAIKGLNKGLRLIDWTIYGKQNLVHPFFPWPELAES